MAAARLLSFMLAFFSTVRSIPAPCDPKIRFPYVFGLEDVIEAPSYNTSVLNMIVVPNTVEVGVIAAVWSQSKLFFYGGTDHGDAGGYHGVVWMMENDHAFRFKTAFTKNQEVLATLVPVILALDPNEDHIAVVYADTQNQFKSMAGKIRFAFRLLSAATGAIEKSMALEPTHLNDKQISMMRNTMSVYKGDYLYFMISTFDSTFRMIFFRIDLSLPSGTNHFYRVYTSSERIRVMKYISWPDASTPTIDYLIAGGCGYVTSSGQHACADQLLFINCSPSSTYLAVDHPIVSIYKDTEPELTYLGIINTFEITALATRTQGNIGHIQFVVQPQCSTDYGSFTTICAPAQSNSFVVRHSTIDFSATNPHTTLTLPSAYRVVFSTSERYEIIDGDFLGDPPYNDIDCIWLMWSQDTDTLHIYRTSKFSSSDGMGHVGVQIQINGQGTWPNYMRPNLNLNLGYISKRVDAWGTDDMILFLSMNSQLDGGDTEFKVIPESSFSAYSLLTTAPQGIVLALKESGTNDITCIDATVPTTSSGMLVAGGTLNNNYFSTWIGEMALIYSGGGTIEAGAHSFMIATSSTSLWEAEGSTDQFSIGVIERAVSFTKTADDSSFCQFVDTSLYGEDPMTNAASRTFKRSSHFMAFTDGTLHDFATMVTTSNSLAYLHLPPLECTSNCDPFEANTCGNPLVIYQRTALGGLSNYYYPSQDSVVSATNLLSRSVLEKIQPKAPYTQVLGFHLAELSHSYASGTALDSVDFPRAYQTMKFGFEITMNTWDRQCVTPSYYNHITNSAADEFSSFNQIPIFFVSEQVQVKSMTLIPLHQYPFSCQVSDFQVFIKKNDGSWVKLYDSISGSPTHSDVQNQKMQAMMGFSKAYSTPVDPAHNDLAWLVNQFKVDVSFQAMVEPQGAYAGLSVADFKAQFTEPADKYINDSPPWSSTNQQYFRMAQLKARPYVGSTLIATENVFNLYFIFCGEDLTVSAENLAEVESTSYVTPNKIVFDPRYEKHILKVDLTTSTSESFSFSSHQFCTQAQCGASNDVCQDPTKHPFTHAYQVKQNTSGAYSSAPTPITITSDFGASANSQVLSVNKDMAYSLESFGPVEDVVIQLANGMRGGATIDTFEFDVWLCTQEWFSANPLVVRYDGTLSMFIGNRLSTSIEISGVPALVGAASFAKFFPIDTGYPTISASLEKTSTSLNPPHFTFTVETSDTQFNGNSIDLAFDFITCLGKNLTIQIPLHFTNSYEAHTAYLGSRAFYDLGQYSSNFALIHSTEITSIDSANSTCKSNSSSLSISITKITSNEIIQLSLKVDLAKAPISCEGATVSIRIDLEVGSAPLGPVVRQLTLQCPFKNALCISPDLSSISEEDERDSKEAPSVEEAAGEDVANSTSETNSTNEEAVVELPQDLEEGLLSLIIGGQVFVYEAVEDDPKPEPPKYAMELVNKDGKSALNFDQPMMRPLDLAKIDYSEVFRFEVVSVLDGSAYEGQWIPSVTTTNGTRKLASDEIASSELTFTWQVTCWETYSICFQFNFSTPANVSSTAFGRDTLKGKVIDPSYFLSASTHMYVDTEEVKDIQVSIIAQGLSSSITQNIEELVAVIKSVGNTAGTSNLLIFYLLGASKQKLWSLMNAMQTIIYSTMADVNLPAHAAFFFQQVFEFAKMDVFSTEEVFAEIGLLETEPLSSQFEEAGFETKSFLINQGSFLVFLVLGVIEYFGRLLMVWICVLLARFKICRMIGIRVDDPTLWATLFRLVMQTYIDIFICIALQAISVYETGWASNFETPQDSINTVLAIITAFVILVFPVYSFLWLWSNRENLSEEDEHGNYWPIYENIRLQSVGPSLYHILFIARRICLVSLLIFSSGVNVFQAIGFLTLSAANLAYLIGWKPFFNPDQNRQEIINETAVYLASHTMFALLNSATPLAFRSQMGWLLVGICILSILYNLFFVIRDLFIFIYRETKSITIRLKTKRTQLGELQRMTKEIKTQEEVHKSSQTFSPSLAQLKKDRDLLEQRLLHHEWSEHREWCLKHKVDLSGWEIEQRYLKNGEALGFFTLLVKEKRLAIERENAKASSHSQKFVDMMKQIKLASVRQSKLNQRLQWLFEVEREGKMTDRLVSRGSFLGLYKKSSLFRLDGRTQTLINSPSSASNDPPISSEELNFRLAQEQLRLLRESEVSDWRTSFQSDKDIAKEIERILNQVFESPIPLNQFHPQLTTNAYLDEEAEDKGIFFIAPDPQGQVRNRGKKIGAQLGRRRGSEIPSEQLPLGDSMAFDENPLSFRAQSTCLNPEEAARKTSSQFCESVSPSKSISLAHQTGNSFAGPSQKKKKRKARKTQGPLDSNKTQFHPAGKKKKKKKKKKLPLESGLDPFYLDYFS